MPSLYLSLVKFISKAILLVKANIIIAVRIFEQKVKATKLSSLLLNPSMV